MRKKLKTFTDKKRGMVLGRFHDFLLPSGAPVTRDLISVDALEWKLEGKKKWSIVEHVRAVILTTH